METEYALLDTFMLDFLRKLHIVLMFNRGVVMSLRAFVRVGTCVSARAREWVIVCACECECASSCVGMWERKCLCG